MYQPRLFYFFAILVIFAGVLDFYFRPGKLTFENYESESLYRGVYNNLHLRYEGRNVDPNDYHFALEGGRCKIIDGRLYVWSAQSHGRLHISDRWGRTLLDFPLTFGKLFIPRILFNNQLLLLGDALPKMYFTNCRVLNLEKSYGVLDTIRISRFQVRLQMGNETRELKLSGDSLSPELLGFFSRLKVNDRVTFYNISFHTIECEVDYLSSISLSVLPNLPVATSYLKLVKQYEQGDRDWLEKVDERTESKYHVAVKSIEDSLPTFTFTNCHSFSDTCRVEVFSIDAQSTSLSKSYEYLGNDCCRIKWFYNGKLISDVNFLHDEWSGPFTIYYRDGQKRMEGTFKLDFIEDTISRLSSFKIRLPAANNSLKERSMHYESVPTGYWKFYSEEGAFTKKHFIDGIEQDN